MATITKKYKLQFSQSTTVTKTIPYIGTVTVRPFDISKEFPTGWSGTWYGFVCQFTPVARGRFKFYAWEGQYRHLLVENGVTQYDRSETEQKSGNPSDVNPWGGKVDIEYRIQRSTAAPGQDYEYHILNNLYLVVSLETNDQILRGKENKILRNNQGKILRLA